MNTESAYLLHILKCFVQNDTPETYEGDWGELLQLAKIHSVGGILGYMMMCSPDRCNQLVLSMLRSVCMSTIAVQAQRGEAMRRRIEQWNDAGIDHLLFKGYVLREYYPVPELRSYGDIDVLIRPEDRQKSDDLMMEQGFARKEDWEPVFGYWKGQEYYEIHTDVMEVDVSDKADYRAYFSHTWERAQRKENHTYLLSPEDHLIYLLTHIAKHISGSGAGIRMYLDIAIYLKAFAGRLDWDYLRRELDQLRFTDFANMVLTMVQVCFGVESPIALKPIDDCVLEDFVDFTMAGGIFGHAGRDSGLVNLKKQDRNEESVSKAKVLTRRLFPSASSIETRYTYLQKRPWLLPAAWVHRLIKTRDTWNAHAKEAQNILNADTEEVLKLKRIYKEIGL